MKWTTNHLKAPLQKSDRNDLKKLLRDSDIDLTTFTGMSTFQKTAVIQTLKTIAVGVSPSLRRCIVTLIQTLTQMLISHISQNESENQ